MDTSEQRGGFDAAAFVRHLRGERPLPDDMVDAVYRALRARWQQIARRRSYPPDLFEDAAHDTWLKMSEKIAQLQDPRRLQAWTDQIFVREMLDLLSARTREQSDDQVGEAVAAMPMWCQPCGGRDAERHQEEQRLIDERLAIVDRFVETLSGRRRDVWTLYLMQHLSSQEVAATIGLSANRVRHIAKNLRDQLMDALQMSAESAPEREP